MSGAGTFPLVRMGAAASIGSLCVLTFVGFALAIPGFGTAANLAGILLASLPVLVLASGQTFVLVSGGIDLSAPSVVGLASIMGGIAMSADAPSVAGVAPWSGPFLMVATGLLAGLLNGVSIGGLRMPAFMVTLAVGMFAGGLAVLLVRLAVNTETMFNLPRAFVAAGGTPVIAGLLAGGSVLAAHALLEGTIYGRMLRAVGYNPRAAAVSGVPVARVIAGAYMISGALAALAAILLTGSLETASPLHGRTLLLDVIGAAVIGGTSLSGGRGHIWGAALGVLFLGMLSNALTLLNVSDFVVTIVKGLLILVAAIVDHSTRLR
jgi:ribose/xylose/arabinose/galactoside ABC-type transport system permease subunit